MANPIRSRRLLTAALLSGTGPSLLTLAKKDGATFGYQFTEASGNLINFQLNSTYDLSVDAVVVRGAASPVSPAKLGYHVPGTAGTGPTNGHCQGLRPTMSGLTSLSLEAVVKWGAVVNNQQVMDAQWVGIAERIGLQVDTNGNAQSYLAAAGGNVGSFANAGTLTNWNHYVWLNDGTNTKMYLNGVFVGTANASMNTMGDGSGASASLAIGGQDPDLGTSTSNTFWAFFASYHNLVLTPAQIAAHAKASGCPAS